MNRISYPVHWLAQCVECDKVWNARNAVAVGALHAKASGHEVRCEVMISTIFNRKQNDSGVGAA